MKIAVEGCAHGELDNIYESIRLLEETENIKVDLLICCGDFQASRNENDLLCMAVPKKYQQLCSFYKYYNGEKTAPVLTIFIGGNHEASNYLQELPYGGWVAPNIYYLGYANVINIAGVRIAGISGIYKGRDYMKGHFEQAPYDESTKRSVYHIRNLEVFRLKQLKEHVDIFLSHDWPTGITDYGNCKQLIKFKPFFKDDITSGKLGSPPCEELLHLLKPSYWFSAHLHCKFAAFVAHPGDKFTKFLALDKCLPKRRFLQIVDVPHDKNLKMKISYDLEWLSILHNTNHLISVKSTTQYMPGPSSNERWCFSPTVEEKEFIFLKFEQELTVPQNFVKTAAISIQNRQPSAETNPQTIQFCKTLGIDDPLVLLKPPSERSLNYAISSNVTASFIEDSEVFDQEYSMTKLCMPSPKNLEIEMVSNTESSACDEKNVSVIEGENAEEFVENCNTRMNKKFKRRNGEMYNNEDN